jgi:hypothetical protein
VVPVREGLKEIGFIEGQTSPSNAAGLTINSTDSMTEPVHNVALSPVMLRVLVWVTGGGDEWQILH